VTSDGHFDDLLTVVTMCAQLARDLLVIAKFLVGLQNVEHSSESVDMFVHQSYVACYLIIISLIRTTMNARVDLQSYFITTFACNFNAKL